MGEYRTHTEPKSFPVDYRQFLRWKSIYDLNELKTLFNGVKEFAFDTETTGLDYTKLKLAGFSVCMDGTNGYYIPIAHKSDVNASRELLDYVVSKIMDDNIHVLMFNKKYDLNVLEIAEGYVIGTRFNVHDAQTATWLRDTDYTMPSLKWASEYFLGYAQPTYEDTVGTSTFDYAKVSDVVEYASMDAICTFRLMKQFFELFPDLRDILALDDQAAEVLRVFERERIRLNLQWLDSEYSKVTFDIKRLEIDIYNLAGYSFNINSGPQVADALIKSGIILKNKTPGGKWATDADTLAEINHPLTKMLIQHSQLSTYLGTFVSNLKEQIGDDGKVRFNYKTCSTVTGRLSSGSDAGNTYFIALNAQNIPKPKQIEVLVYKDLNAITGWSIASLADSCNLNEKGHPVSMKPEYGEYGYICETGTSSSIRSAFLPDDDESVWVSFDYSGQELRIAANFSGEPVFVNAFKTGGDPHMETAKKIYGAQADKNDRRNAKGANFALQYGGTDYTLKVNLGITKQEAKVFFDAYCKSMNVLVDWQGYMKRLARKTGVVETAFGRKFRLKKFFKDTASWKQQSAGERYALNYPIQGTGGDVIRIVLVRVYKFFDAMVRRGLNGFTFKSTVHDEVNFSVKKSFLHTFVINVPEMAIMDFPGWEVPLTVDLSIGPNWAEQISYKYDEATRVYTPKGTLIKN